MEEPPPCPAPVDAQSLFTCAILVGPEPSRPQTMAVMAMMPIKMLPGTCFHIQKHRG